MLRDKRQKPSCYIAVFETVKLGSTALEKINTLLDGEIVRQ